MEDRSSKNQFEIAVEQFNRAADIMKLDDNSAEILKKATKSFDCKHSC